MRHDDAGDGRVSEDGAATIRDGQPVLGGDIRAANIHDLPDFDGRELADLWSSFHDILAEDAATPVV